MDDYGWIFSKAPWRVKSESIIRIIIEYGTTSIGKNAFRNCENLKSITIPESISSIGEAAFISCWKLKSIAIPEGVMSIDK